MDELESRLKKDAEAIDTTVSPQLRSRIDASLHAAEQDRKDATGAQPGHRLWWLSSLTGLAAALLVIALLNVNRDEPGADVPVESPTARSVDPFGRPLAESFPLDARPAVLTGPLQEELDNLQTDLEKVRESVEEDIRLAF